MAVYQVQFVAEDSNGIQSNESLTTKAESGDKAVEVVNEIAKVIEIKSVTRLADS